MFSTERLLIRGLKPSDKEDGISKLFQIPQDILMSTEFPPVPRGTKFIDFVYDIVAQGVMFCPIEELKNPGVFIGFISINTSPNPRNRIGTIGIDLLPEFQSKGYGTELMEFLVNYGLKNLGLHRMDLCVFHDNEKAIKLYESLGFVREGVQRKRTWGTTYWRDSIVMSILEDEWKERINTV